MKPFWVFWTYQANYASHPIRVETDNFRDAIVAASMYDPYEEENGKRQRFIVFEEGGSLVWDGPAPRLDDSPGNVVEGLQAALSKGTVLGKGSEHENDLQWLYETHVAGAGGVYLPDHMVPFLSKVKWAAIVGNEDAPDAIYLSTKEEPQVDDLLYRFS